MQLAELKVLEELDVTDCGLTGDYTAKSPFAFIYLSNLSPLHTSAKKHPVIPPVVFKLPSLVRLKLDNNMLAGAIPSNISALTSLKFLDLAHNELTSGVQNIAGLTQLAHVDLGFNKLSGVTCNMCSQTMVTL